MKYEVTKKFGKYRVGSIVDDKDIYIRRKVEEGGCLTPFEKKSHSEEKMAKEKYEDKMMKEPKKGENK